MEIKIENLSFSYDKKSKQVLNNVDLTLSSGNLYVLTGMNGAGKTTLTKIVCGLLKTRTGRILIDGNDTKKMSVGKIAERIGYLFQNPEMQLFATSVIEELRFPLEITRTLTPENEVRISKALEIFGLSGMEDRFPLLMSGGEKQRLALASIAVRNVGFLMLDEPTASIDEDGRKFLADYINSYVAAGGGALIITHDEDFIPSLHDPISLRMEAGRI